jgi:hypothetical protein
MLNECYPAALGFSLGLLHKRNLDARSAKIVLTTHWTHMKQHSATFTRLLKAAATFLILLPPALSAIADCIERARMAY